MNRPDPDQLLAELNSRELQAKLAPLRVWFGASPGVGKTFAMLAAGHKKLKEGVDVVIGCVETHGRSDTAALVEGLPQLPAREVELAGGRVGREFDVDAALARKPQLLLVDELAHSNLPGSRHPKRWQDVAELRSAGIEVWTTVNVQHLESLNDVVGGITGVRVRETVPDHVFDTASEIVLIDLPADELLTRLKQGKVYMPEAAERALQNFFRKGNLIALRELALRRTADRVDADVRSYRREQAVDTVWHTTESLLACVDGSVHAATVVRRCARLAARLEVPWHALHVDRSGLAHASEQMRAQAIEALALAQELGAVGVTLSGEDSAVEACQYARQHNLGTLVIGPPAKPRWFGSGVSFASRIARHSPDMVVIQVGAETSAAVAPAVVETSSPFQSPPLDYLKALGLMALVTVLATPLYARIELTNIVMLFLLAVLGCAFWLGRGPSVLGALASVLAFDFFFVPPRLSFAVSDWQYLITFGVMLSVALVTGQLTARLRFQSRIARSRERRAQTLFETARELASALADEQIVEIAQRAMHSAFAARTELWVLGLDEELHLEGSQAPLTDPGIARWALDHNQQAGIGTDTLAGAAARYVPLQAPMRKRGVLALTLDQPSLLKIPEQQRLLDTFASLIALALERVHYTTVAREALVRMESERLRNSLLSAVSHDLRTPLTAMRGLAERLAQGVPTLTDQQRGLAEALHQESLRMSNLVENLLQMARIEAGEVQLNKSWWPLEELVGSALAARRSALAQHSIRIDLPTDLPLVEVDATLIEQVLCNLLENAAKYSQAGTEIHIGARVAEAVSGARSKQMLEIRISDQGPGLPGGTASRLFEKFVRGDQESAATGIGLGLWICKAIVLAHDGQIDAENRAGGGASFVVRLPLGPAPSLPE